ncbi:MAG: YcgN family cysteine cluster protein [Desulfobacterales bacterium]
MVDSASPFWKSTPLEAMSESQWEALCDGCGRCCLEKVKDYRTGKIFYTDQACPLLDLSSCRCRDYLRRSRIIPECVALRPGPARVLRWLPRTCAYRLLAEGKELAWWHPLVSGRPETVHEAGISIRGRRVFHRRDGACRDLEAHIVRWGFWARKAGVETRR